MSAVTLRYNAGPMLRSRLWIVVCALLSASACSSSAERDQPEPAAEGAEPARAGAVADQAAQGPDRDRVLAFCVANMTTMVECLDDQSFWNILGTLYIGGQPELAANPNAKEGWIEIMKDAVGTLHREGELEPNCEATLEHTLWPTTEQMQKVDEARALSCADFANAFGWMMFGEGVFHAER
jgi:hypothetical protein